MTLDPHTLLVVNVANLLTLAILLPAIMGHRLSPAARAARRSLIVHAGAWIAVILSELGTPYWLNLVLSTTSMVCYSLCNVLLFQAMNGWLGPRRGQRALHVLAIAMPIGYALLFPSYALRVGWANLLIAAQIALLAAATAQAATHRVGPWRLALFACFSMMAALTLGRGILGAFFSADYPNFAAPHPVNLLALLISNLTTVLCNVAVLVAWREEAEQQLHALAITDPLTGILNRQGWNTQAERLFSNAQRYGQALALLTFDLDHFKQINDTNGHETGDRALRLFGQLLHTQLRSGDLAARLGGEEFCVLLPMADEEAARSFDRRLREQLAQQSFDTLGFVLDFSCGLACLGAHATTLNVLYQHADAALYAAKHAGRGHLRAAPASAPA